MVAQLVTTMLIQNPVIVKNVYVACFDVNDVVRKVNLLALGNALCSREDFATAYEDGM